LRSRQSGVPVPERALRGVMPAAFVEECLPQPLQVVPVSGRQTHGQGRSVGRSTRGGHRGMASSNASASAGLSLSTWYTSGPTGGCDRKNANLPAGAPGQQVGTQRRQVDAPQVVVGEARQSIPKYLAGNLSATPGRCFRLRGAAPDEEGRRRWPMWPPGQVGIFEERGDLAGRAIGVADRQAVRS